jgi:hypothetical protein
MSLLKKIQTTFGLDFSGFWILDTAFGKSDEYLSQDGTGCSIRQKGESRFFRAAALQGPQTGWNSQ